MTVSNDGPRYHQQKNADDQEGNLDASIFTVFQRKRVHVKVLTMTHDKGDMGPTKGESTPVSEYKMPSFQRMLSILTSNSTNLRIQISELNQLHEQLRKALQSAQSGGRECELNVQHIPEGGQLIARSKLAAAWARPFDNPIHLPGGRELVTLRDAGDYIMKLPKAEQDLDEWQAAVEALLLVVELSGPTTMARIGMLRAHNRHVERVLNRRAKTRIGENGS